MAILRSALQVCIVGEAVLLGRPAYAFAVGWWIAHRVSKHTDRLALRHELCLF